MPKTAALLLLLVQCCAVHAQLYFMGAYALYPTNCDGTMRSFTSPHLFIGAAAVSPAVCLTFGRNPSTRGCSCPPMASDVVVSTIAFSDCPQPGKGELHLCFRLWSQQSAFKGLYLWDPVNSRCLFPNIATRMFALRCVL